MQVTIKDKLYKDIVSYCELNGLEVNGFINDLIKKNFMIEKYGEKPGISKSQVSEPLNELLNEPLNELLKPEIDAVKEMEKLLAVESKRAAREATKDIIQKSEDEVPVVTEQTKKKHRKLT